MDLKIPICRVFSTLSLFSKLDYRMKLFRQICKRCASLVAGIAWTLTASSIAVAQSPSDFRFYSRMPVQTLPPVSPELSTPALYSYRTRLREAAASPVNFASRFRLQIWSCGDGNCLTGAVVNRVTGQVTLLPFQICCAENANDPNFKAIDFRSDSHLIVLNGRINGQGQIGAYYYEFMDPGFRYVETRPISQNSIQTARSNPPIASGDIASCSSIENSNSRLGCYDRASARSASSGTSFSAPSLGLTTNDDTNRTIATVRSALMREAAKRNVSLQELMRSTNSSEVDVYATVAALIESGVSADEAVSSLFKIGDAARDPDKRLLMQCMGVQVYTTPRSPPSKAECETVARRLGVPTP